MDTFTIVVMITQLTIIIAQTVMMAIMAKRVHMLEQRIVRMRREALIEAGILKTYSVTDKENQ